MYAGSRVKKKSLKIPCKELQFYDQVIGATTSNLLEIDLHLDGAVSNLFYL
jgi:hypothetical protein